jgi:folate-binding protein YgfZ
MTADRLQLDLVDGYRALREGAVAFWLPRDVVRVSGPDAIGYLQGQLSQDIGAIAVGGSAWSLVLQPQGKVDAFVRVTRIGTDDCLLDTDGGFGAALVQRLTRFKLRTKADIEVLDWRCLAVRGPAEAVAAVDVEGLHVGGVVVVADWPLIGGVDILGPDVSEPAGVPSVSDEVYALARIQAGIPAMGAELTERTIPAESGIVDRAVSFTKGCYTGQELVARIDSRGGNVPRHLRGVLINDQDGSVPGGRAGPNTPVEPNAPVEVGAPVEVDGRPVGELTSVARHPDGGYVGLAYIKRDTDLPVAAQVMTGSRSLVARIEALPLLS